MKICEVIWIVQIIFERQGPEKGTFLFLLSLHGKKVTGNTINVCYHKKLTLPKDSGSGTNPDSIFKSTIIILVVSSLCTAQGAISEQRCLRDTRVEKKAP